MKFKEGQRVKLLADAEEGWPEEIARIIEYEGNDLYCVRVESEYLDGPDDDGLREVLIENMEAL